MHLEMPVRFLTISISLNVIYSNSLYPIWLNVTIIRKCHAPLLTDMEINNIMTVAYGDIQQNRGGMLQ